MLCFKVAYTTEAKRASDNIPFNVLYLFRPTSVQLGGSLVWNCAEGEHYIQQRLLVQDKDQISAKKIGLHIPLGTESIATGDYSRADDGRKVVTR